jgi:hypothetical protein
MAKRASTALTEAERESTIQRDIRLLLGGRRDCMAIRINTGVFKPIDAKANDRRIIRSAPTGTHDILCCQLRRTPIREVINPHGFNPVEQDAWVYYGQFISFETKSKDGRRRKEQVDFAKALIARGGESHFVRSIEQVQAIIGPLPDWIDEIPEHLQFHP